ncbi:hypothetical protein Tco_0997635 [Tanacetum coccineum]
MLEKSMYDSWASRIRLFIKGKKHGRMMLDSIDIGQLVYPTVKENRQIHPKKYSELNEAQQLQDDFQVNTKFLNALPSEWSKFFTDVKLAKSFYTTNYDQLFLQSNNQLRMSSNPRNQATIQDGRVTVQQIQGRQSQRYAILETEEMLLLKNEIMQLASQEL